MTDVTTPSLPPAAMSGSLRIGLFSFPRLVHGGGFEEYLIALAASLTARGHNVRIVNASPREYRALNVALNVYYRNPLFSDNTRTTASEIRARLGQARLFELPIHKMARVLRGCDVIYAKNELLDLSVLRVLRMARLPPIVCGVHTALCYPQADSPQAKLHNMLYRGGLYRVLLKGAAAVHVLNRYEANVVEGIHGWPRDRIVRIPPWCSLNGDEPLHGVPSEGPLRVLWGARMTEQKGVDTLIKIIDAFNARADADAYFFVIAGSGDPRFEAKVRSAAGRYDNVRYLGHVPHGEMSRHYREADAALVTSNWETFGYSALEPQSLGVPVVASDIPGSADIVEDGATGFLFAPDNINAAVAALRRVRELKTNSPGVLQVMREAARRRVREQFDPAMIADQLERMLREVAANGKPGSTREW